MVADPQGIPFYIMRGVERREQHRLGPDGHGQVQLERAQHAATRPAPTTFYADVFGWTYPDKMPMGEMGDYVFIEAAGETIGATMTAPAGQPAAGWHFYFRTPDIERRRRR